MTIIMRLIKQMYSDDCCVAACAMACGLSYSVVLAKAKEIGFVPDADVGVEPGDLLKALGYHYEQMPGFYSPDPERKQLLCIRAPDDPKDYHAVILYDGFVYDPVGLLFGVNTGYCLLNTVFTYWGINRLKQQKL